MEKVYDEIKSMRLTASDNDVYFFEVQAAENASKTMMHDFCMKLHNCLEASGIRYIIVPKIGDLPIVSVNPMEDYLDKYPQSFKIKLHQFIERFVGHNTTVYIYKENFIKDENGTEPADE